MKFAICLILAAILCATASAQTIKPLSYNVSNNAVIAPTNTNAITFTSPVTFSNDTAGTTITSLSVGFNMGGAGGSDLVLWSAIYFDDLYDGDIQAKTRTNLNLGLPALTNTSNVTMMRALSGSTNTNHPYSGTVALTNTNAVLTFSNGILQSVQ